MIEGMTVERVSLSAEAAETILQTAADAGHTHGIGYWAEWHPTRPHAIREHNDSRDEAERGPWIMLTRGGLERGCVQALNAGHDLSDLDGPTADIVIQYAALGEQRYG